jgi:hypothetical protein
MGKYKNDIKTIAEVAIFLLIVFGAAFLHNNLFTIFSFCIWVFYLVYRLVKKLKYKHGKSDAILFPTLNDAYFKFSAITIGLFILIGDIIWYRMSHYFDIYVLLFAIIGILFLFNGIYSIPNGELTFNKGTLHFAGMDKAINLNEILSIKIHKSSIIVFSSEEAMTRVVNLMLGEQNAEVIKTHLINNGVSSNSIIVNLVD